jgi:hypothetical protein
MRLKVLSAWKTTRYIMKHEDDDFIPPQRPCRSLRTTANTEVEIGHPFVSLRKFKDVNENRSRFLFIICLIISGVGIAQSVKLRDGRPGFSSR